MNLISPDGNVPSAWATRGYPLKGWAWLGWAVGIWTLPACMLATWGAFYAEHFGEPSPYHPWPARALDALFVLNAVAVAFFLYKSTRHPLYLTLALLVATVEVLVTAWIWFLGGMSVSGFYF